MSRFVGLCLLLIFVLPVRAEVIVSEAWVREAPPGSQMLAAYMTLKNDSQKTIAVVNISSADFQRIELHRSSTHAGMMQMKKLDRLTLEAGKTVSLKPSGTHLMLFKPKRMLREGDRVGFSLQLNNGLALPVVAEVRRYR